MEGTPNHPETTSRDIARTLVQVVATRIDADRTSLLSHEVVNVLKLKYELALDLIEILAHCHRNGRTDDVYYDATIGVLQQSLLEIRLAAEHDRASAQRVLKEVEKRFAEFVPKFGADFSSVVLQLLSEAKIEPGAFLKEAIVSAAYDQVKDATPITKSPQFVMDSFFATQKGSAFVLCEILIRQLGVHPEAVQATFLCALIHSKNVKAREVAGLLLLHPHASIRATMAKTWLSMPENATPALLRRLIVMRNWLPEGDRPAIDQLIKQIRSTGTACAPAERGKLHRLYVSTIDGAGAMVFYGAFKTQNRTFTTFGFVCKQNIGFRDSWIQTDVSEKDTRSFLRNMVSTKEILGEISPECIDIAVPYFLAVSVQQGNVPDPKLLQLVELFGATWVPSFEVLAKSLADVVPRKPQKPDEWLCQPFGESWFEEDARVERYSAEEILQNTLEKRRAFWSEKLCILALTNKMGKRLPLPSANELVFVAREIEDKKKTLGDIPFARALAEESVRVALMRM